VGSRDRFGIRKKVEQVESLPRGRLARGLGGTSEYLINLAEEKRSSFQRKEKGESLVAEELKSAYKREWKFEFCQNGAKGTEEEATREIIASLREVIDGITRKGGSRRETAAKGSKRAQLRICPIIRCPLETSNGRWGPTKAQIFGGREGYYIFIKAQK